jgi:hypothetical protein
VRDVRVWKRKTRLLAALATLALCGITIATLRYLPAAGERTMFDMPTDVVVTALLLPFGLLALSDFHARRQERADREYDVG